MRIFRIIISVIVATTSCAFASGEGKFYPRLQAGDKVYYQVRVQTVTPTQATIVHSKGLASINLHDLHPDLQKAFGYSSESADIYQTKLAAKKAEAQKIRDAQMDYLRAARERKVSGSGDFLSDSGPLEIRPEVDLRPEFAELGLYAKDQGRRPSCAVFAVVGAIEFETARVKGESPRFSEDYLIWATLKYKNQDAGALKGVLESLEGNEDAGFRFDEVLNAASQYGVALSEDMPNTFGKSMSAITDPPVPVQQKAKDQRNLRIHWISDSDHAKQLEDIIEVLNLGRPVVLGVGWPSYKTITPRPYISGQKALYGHAITIVGYQNETGKKEDTVFIFRNSWGTDWGAAGHGFVTYDYLMKNLYGGGVITVVP